MLNHRSAIWGVLILAGLCLFLGIRMTVAGAFAHQAQSFLDDWEQKGSAPSDRAWHVAYTAAMRSVEFYPVPSGDYYDRLGRVHEWQEVSEPLGAEAAAPSRREALVAYRRSVEWRPLWPYTWVRLAYTKLSLLALDDEFDRALAKAARLGPWRIDVNQPLAEIGLIAWPSLDGAQRELVMRSARRTVAFGKKETRALFAMAEKTGMTDRVCEAIESEVVDKEGYCAAG